MAVFHYTYSYKQYVDSKLATWADKQVQSSSHLIMFFDFFFFWSLAGFIAFVMPPIDSMPDWLALLIMAVMLVCFIVAPVALPIVLKAVWNKKCLNDKLALLDIRRRQDEALNRKFKTGVALLIVGILLPFLLAVVALLIRNAA